MIFQFWLFKEISKVICLSSRAGGKLVKVKIFGINYVNVRMDISRIGMVGGREAGGVIKCQFI